MMNKIILTLLFFVGIVTTSINADATNVDVRRTFQYYTTISEFMGDKHGEFKGDLVIGLGDGSAWKVHPTDREKVTRWLANEIVHPQVRTSFYWFKREHKFEIYNHNRKESVKAMLVQYPYAPLIITDAVEYVSSTSVTYTQRQTESGHVIVTPHVINHYAKRLFLNDYTTLTINSNLSSFNIGDIVYLGYNTNKSVFVITGIEREAKYSFVK